MGPLHTRRLVGLHVSFSRALQNSSDINLRMALLPRDEILHQRRVLTQYSGWHKVIAASRGLFDKFALPQSAFHDAEQRG